jgi:hypothetical protein
MPQPEGIYMPEAPTVNKIKFPAYLTGVAWIRTKEDG